MTKKLPQNLWAKVETEFSLLVHDSKARNVFLLFLTLVLLPTQVGLHFWPSFSFVNGQRIDYLSPTLYATDICVALLFIGNLKAFVKSIRVLPVCLFLFLSIGIVLSQSPFAGWYGIIKLFEFVFLGWMIARYAKEVELFLPAVFLIGVMVESLLSWWQFFLQSSVGGLWYFLGERTFSASTPGIANASLNNQLILRPYATFSHPNVLAGYILVALLFLILHFSAKNKSYAFLQGIVIGVGCVTLCLTLSRTAIALGLALFLIFIVRKLFLIKQKMSKIGLVSISLLGVFVLLFLLSPRFIGINAYGDSITQRIALLKAGFVLFATHPLFGVGLQNIYISLPQISQELYIIQPVHNIFILALAETGIVGFLFLIYFLWKTYRHIAISSLSKNMKAFTFLSLFVFLIVGMVDHYFVTLQQGQLLSALIFGTAWASGKNK